MANKIRYCFLPAHVGKHAEFAQNDERFRVKELETPLETAEREKRKAMSGLLDHTTERRSVLMNRRGKEYWGIFKTFCPIQRVQNVLVVNGVI